jgi:ABC-type multidrug transport system fused ATPase/permease subunit
MGSLKLIEPFIYKYKYYLILYSIFVLLAYPLESLIVPRIFGKFFETIKNKLASEPIANQVYFDLIKQVLLFSTIISIAQTLISKLDIYLIPEFNESISNTFFENILIHYENNYTDLELGKILTRINGLPSVLREVSTDLFSWVLPKLFTIIVVNFYFFKNDIGLGVVSIVILILVILLNINSFKPCVDISHERYITYENKSENLQDKLANLYSIYASGNVKEEINNFNVTTNEFKNIHRKSLKCTNILKSRNSLFITVIFISLSFYITSIYVKKIITNQQLSILFMVLLFYIPCLNTIITYLPDYTNHLGIITSVDDFIDTICAKNNTKPDIIITNGVINIKNLTFGYNKKKNIFENFNLAIESREKIGIIGPSGNGKSTLIKIIMGYYEVPKNTIFIDGQDISDYNLNSLRKQITYINQNTKLFNKTIFENIKYGNNISNDDILAIYDKYKLDNIFKNLADGFNTNVGVNGDSISGGQKQVVLLLRNYFKQNKICILDEPTAALDDKTRNTIIKIIKHISHNTTLLIITHDNYNLELIQRKIELLNGIIVN